MKSTYLFLVLLPLLLSPLPLAAGDDDPAKQKDECLLIARDCSTRVQSIQDKIERLREEIAKGTAVYSPEELRALRQKLEDANRTLDFLGSPR